MIKAIIFDLDGVIVDTEGLKSRAYEEIIKSYGKKPTFTKLGTVHEAGQPAKNIVEKSKMTTK